jgi:hypothetical protein
MRRWRIFGVLVASGLVAAAALPGAGSTTAAPKLWGFHSSGPAPRSTLHLPGLRTVSVLLEGVNASTVDQPPSGTSAGDEIIGEGRLVGPHNAPAGLLEVQETLTGLGSESGTGRIQMQATALLAGGQIDLAGVLRFNSSRSPSVAIVGGTGAYRGARGQMFVRTSGQNTLLVFALLRG